MTVDGVVELIKKLSEYDRIFIDTKGSNFLSLEEAEKFSDSFSSIKKEMFLVLSATSDLMTNERIMQNFEKAGYDQLIFSKLDETVRHGGLWSLSMKSKMPLGYFTDGQRVPEDIKAASVEHLFNLVMKPKKG